MAEKLTYEQALAELEEITRSMEEGDLPLEESVRAYKRGMELLKVCRSKLARADAEIRKLEESGEMTALTSSDLRENSAGDEPEEPEPASPGRGDDDIPF